MLLYKLVNGGILDSVNGVISTGKEAVIFHADGGPGPEEAEEPYNVPKECVLKVFKTTLNEFKTRDKYIRVSLLDRSSISTRSFLSRSFWIFRMTTGSATDSVNRIRVRLSTCGKKR